jgi:hypothetical protein
MVRSARNCVGVRGLVQMVHVETLEPIEVSPLLATTGDTATGSAMKAQRLRRAGVLNSSGVSGARTGDPCCWLRFIRIKGAFVARAAWRDEELLVMMASWGWTELLEALVAVGPCLASPGSDPAGGTHPRRPNGPLELV